MATKPRLLKGFRDYLPEIMTPKAAMLRQVEATFQRHGFAPLQTPALEYAEVLLGKYGVEGDKLLYRFRDLGGRDVALRYDLTVPLARVVAQYAELEQPFRRYQIGPVWRAEKPGPGRYREFLQCDVDITGSGDVLAEAEILAVAAAVLRGLGVGDFRIRLNHRGLLDACLRRAGVTDPELRAAALRAMDKLPKIGAAGVRRELAAHGIGGEAERAIFEFLAAGEGGEEPADRWERLARLFRGDPGGEEAIGELRRLFALLDTMELAGTVSLDLRIARGLDYYTGAIYETFLVGHEEKGSVMSGGRYDGLIGAFRGQPVPAVGISLGIDRLFQALLELGLVERRRATARVLVAVFDDTTAPAAAALAAALRSRGVAAELYPARDRLKKQFRYADRKGIPFVALRGPDELRSGMVKWKELATGREEALPPAALPTGLGLGGD